MAERPLFGVLLNRKNKYRKAMQNHTDLVKDGPGSLSVSRFIESVWCGPSWPGLDVLFSRSSKRYSSMFLGGGRCQGDHIEAWPKCVMCLTAV